LYLDDEYRHPANTERQRKYVDDGWNLTGDVYTMDEDGYFWYQARSDDMIVSAGYNISGPEVEGVLMEHPKVVECAVVGLEHPTRGQGQPEWKVQFAGKHSRRISTDPHEGGLTEGGKPGDAGKQNQPESNHTVQPYVAPQVDIVGGEQRHNRQHRKEQD
jgi:acyl-CoA synthetase (AMP-forming)/AMP-acid ligase II